MTREESIDRLRKISEKTPIRTNGDDLVAITMAIQALSQEPQCTEHPCLGTLCRYYKEPCDDAISRDALKKMLIGLDKWHVKNKQFVNVGLLYDDVFFGIEQLPSVTQKSETVTEFADRCRECGARYGKLLKQKSGHWISHYDEDEKVGWYECDRCHTERAFNTKFCPDCGACMREGRTLDEFIEDNKESEVRNEDDM